MTLKSQGYQFVAWAGAGTVTLREIESGKLELFAARAGGYSGWHLDWRGTSWEFCRSVEA